MNIKNIATTCSMLAAMLLGAAQAQETGDKPIIAVPAFSNQTNGHVTRVAPGSYTSTVKRAAKEQLDVDTNADNSRYIENLTVEYAPGEWRLPAIAGEIAADAANNAIAATRRFRILSRSEPAIQAAEKELAYQSSGSSDSSSLLSALKSMNAKYLMRGRINRFRVDETTAFAYGVNRRQVITSISLDLNIIDVQTMEIIAGESMQERIVLRIPHGVTNMTSIYDWEAIMRKAISTCVPKFLAKLNISSGAPDELEHSAPMVEVSINSAPEGADVEFNGDFVGNTPCTVSIPSVPGMLSISAAGYEPWRKRIKPNAGLKIAPRLKEIKVTPLPQERPQQPQHPEAQLQTL